MYQIGITYLADVLKLFVSWKITSLFCSPTILHAFKNILCLEEEIWLHSDTMCIYI